MFEETTALVKNIKKTIPPNDTSLPPKAAIINRIKQTTANIKSITV